MSEIIGEPSTPLHGLFKYLPPNKLDLFEMGLILLTPPKYLNDPWDFLQKAPIFTDAHGYKEWQKLEKELVERPDLPVDPIYAKLNSDLRLQCFILAVRKKEAGKEYPSFFREEFSKNNGIVSLTEKPLCRLMWAHYAESHKGFVAEFATDGSLIYDRRFFYNCINVQVAKVAYSFKWETYNHDNICNQIWSKHHDWTYEAEWRIIWDLKYSKTHRTKLLGDTEEKNYHCLQFKPTNLKRVIFGLNMDSKIRERLCNMLSKDIFEHVRRETTDINDENGELILKPMAV